LVKQYNMDILKHIITVANLTSGAYGLFDPQKSRNMVVFTEEPDPQQIMEGMESLQEAPGKKQGFAIDVNVQRIITESQQKAAAEGEADLWEIYAVAEIASTIIHEAVHTVETEQTGTTSEGGPEGAERDFINWFKNNLQSIVEQYPEIKPEVSDDVFQAV